MKNMEIGEISEKSESSEDKASNMDNEKFSPVKISKLSITKIMNFEGISETSQSVISNSCNSVPVTSVSVNDDSPTVEIYKSSVNEIVSEEISKIVSDTCDAVQVIVSHDSSAVDIFEPLVNEIAVSEEISKLVSDTCDTVQIIVNNDANGLSGDSRGLALNVATTDSEGIPKTVETANNDLYDAEMGDHNCDSGDKISEMNEEDEECSNKFVETDARHPVRKERHWTERASLPYYREPKPDFFEYTRKLQEELDPKPSVISSPCMPKSSMRTIVLDEPAEPNNQEFDLIKSPTTFGIDRSKTPTAFNMCLKKSNGTPSVKPASGLIILDDYKSPRVKNSHYSRSSDIWNASTLQSTKEKPEPVPGSKYKALKEQLMEKIMLKKEASFNKRKEEQEVDEEIFEEEEDVVSDVSPYESENGLSDDDLEDDSPENADDVVLKDMLLKECETFPDNVSRETKDISSLKDSEAEGFNPGSAIGEDSQEPMECYSLPSYQPGGGFANSPLQKGSMKRIFSDSDFNDSALNSPSQQRSKGRIFSDSDFIDSSLSSPSQQKSKGRIFSDSDFNDSAPNESSRPNQWKNISNLEFKDSTDEQLLFEDSNEAEIIPHWESLPISEKQGSQLFDEDISVICSGKFPSTNEDIPWTPSSSMKNSLPNKESTAFPSYSSNHANNETEQLNESDDELVRPAKKIKLSMVEKLWDSEDENDVESKDPIAENGEFKGNHRGIQSDSDDDVEQDHEPDVDTEEDELDDQSEISQKDVNELFEESHVKDAAGEEPTKKFEIKNFFENEAELSGEEGSSDENEDDADEFMEDEMITDEIVASDEKLRKEVGTIHFKRQQDEDDQIIRQLKNDFLPEGELYNENGQRKRRFIWNNIGTDDNEFTETKSDSEEEEIESLPTDYLKWQQEKNKSNLPEDDDVEIVQTPKSIGLKVDIVGKVSVTRCSSISNSSISASPMLRRGSFLNSSLGKNLKFIKEFSSSEGSISRKNFVFSSPQPNASLPPTPSSEVKSTKIINVINNRSIFNKI